MTPLNFEKIPVPYVECFGLTPFQVWNISDAMRLMHLLKSTTAMVFCGSAAVWTPAVAQDIFSTPAPATSAQLVPYPTSAALMAAVKSGEIPDFCLDDGEFASHMNPLGRSILAILHNEYGVDTQSSAHTASPNIPLALLIQDITKYEINDNNPHVVAVYQGNHKILVRGYPQIAQGFDKLARDYSTAVKEYIVLKKQRENAQQSAVAEQQHQADVAVQQMQDKAQQEKAIADGQLASQKAEDDIKDAAAKDAREAQEKARKQKLDEVLESNTYKLWKAALKIEAGEKMIVDGQNTLDHDDAVQKASGVSDLAERHTAGDDIVAGKTLVKQAFAEYIELGGTAGTPEAVQSGPDPAAPYR